METKHVEKLPDGRVVLSAEAWRRLHSEMVKAEYHQRGPLRVPPQQSERDVLLWLRTATEASGYELEQLC